MKTRSTLFALLLSYSAMTAIATAEETACSSHLTELGFSLQASELPQRSLIDLINEDCSRDISDVVRQEITQLRIVVLSSQVNFLEANRIESYAELEHSINKANTGKRASGNQAFGVTLQALGPVLSVQLQ